MNNICKICNKEFNEKSFINAMNYSNKDLMEFIKYFAVVP